MEWIRTVTIVFESELPPEMRGRHNGRYQAVVLLLRSDGKMFYHGKHSKVTLEGLMAQEESGRFWKKKLIDEASDHKPMSVEQFLADCEDQRKRLNGAYL